MYFLQNSQPILPSGLEYLQHNIHWEIIGCKSKSCIMVKIFVHTILPVKSFLLKWNVPAHSPHLTWSGSMWHFMFQNYKNPIQSSVKIFFTQSDPKANGTKRILTDTFTVYFSTVRKQTNNINLYIWFTFLQHCKGF